MFSAWVCRCLTWGGGVEGSGWLRVCLCLFVARLQRGKKQQIENGSGAEDNGDSSHCSNASTHSNQEAGPSNKRTKTSDDSGLELDNNNTTVAIDPVMDGASEIELVFRPHPTLMENDDSAQTRSVAPGHLQVFCC